MKSLLMINEDNVYTNLALLLSDECPHSIKLAVFEGDTKEKFKTRYKFTGSLFKQLRDAYDFIDRYNNTKAEIKGLERIDNRDNPEIAIRGALLNAIVHKDYSYSASTLINMIQKLK